MAEGRQQRDAFERGGLDDAIALRLQWAVKTERGFMPDKRVSRGNTRDNDAAAVEHRDHPICRQVLAANDLAKRPQIRVQRQHIDDGSIRAFDRHVDRDDRARPHGALVKVRHRRAAGRKYLPRRFEVWPDRQRRPGRQDRVHDLLAVFLQQQDVAAGKLLRHDGFGLRAERIEVAGLQRARDRQRLQGRDTRLQLLVRSAATCCGPAPGSGDRWPQPPRGIPDIHGRG